MRRRGIAAFALALSLAAGATYAVRVKANRMPDLSSATEIARGVVFCHRPVGRVNYDTDGNLSNGEEYAAFYLLDDPNRKAPFAVVVFDGNNVKEVLIDKDGDGRVDVRGKPGDPGIGFGICDILSSRSDIDRAGHGDADVGG